MPRYDFKTLSPQDFEELTRDLIQAEWSVSLEAFKTGRDNGIDLRYTQAGTPSTIVQCKHYASSTFAKLLAHLRDEELPKVIRLAPNRYVIVTSLALSPSDKDKLLEAMRPFVVSPADVVGLDDLNGLLARHGEVERRNFKLWLTSTEVITRILHNAEACQTEFEVDRIRKKLPMFVQSRAYPRARQILDEQRVVILSGVPGIGKTTLAEMLMFAHLDDGYEPVVIQTDVTEGKRLFRKDRKQIFYYDDFLGQTFLGDQRSYTGRNHDAALVSFMEMVRSTPDSRFILTTREHILRQAMQASERLHQSAAQTYKCVLELGDYSFGQRARILYNHLYFSDLPRPYREAILHHDFFLEIIKHEHFNPRLIEWLTTLSRLSSPPPERYCESIAVLLRSPDRIWSHAFEAQISDSARDLLLAFYSLGEWVDVEELEPVFEGIHRGASQRYNRPRAAGDFRDALQELDDSFLSYHAGHASFLNPSIRDFTAGVLCANPGIALNLIVDAVRFKQIVNVWRLASEPTGSALRSALLADSSTMRAHAARLVVGPSMRWVTTPGGRSGYPIDTSKERRLDSIVEWCEAAKSPAFVELAVTDADQLLQQWNKSSVDFGDAIDSLSTMKDSEWFLEHGGRAIYRTVLDGLLSHVEEAWSNDWTRLLELSEEAVGWTEGDKRLLSEGLDYYRKNGVRHEQDQCDDVSDMTELKGTLAELEQKYSLGLGPTIASLEEAIQEREDNARHDDEEGGGFSHKSTPPAADTMSEDDVRSMFGGLLPRDD